MHGLIHKKKKRKMETIFKRINHNKQRLAYSFWFCPVLLFSLDKCASCNPSASHAGIWFGHFPIMT